MDKGNCSSITEFIFLGISDNAVENNDPIYHNFPCLSHYSSGKSWNDNPDQNGSPDAHTHVLFPQPPLLQ